VFPNSTIGQLTWAVEEKTGLSMSKTMIYARLTTNNNVPLNSNATMSQCGIKSGTILDLEKSRQPFLYK